MEKIINIEILQDMQEVQAKNNLFNLNDKYMGEVDCGNQFMFELVNLCLNEFKNSPLVHFESIESLKISQLKYR